MRKSAIISIVQLIILNINTYNDKTYNNEIETALSIGGVCVLLRNSIRFIWIQFYHAFIASNSL